jgi:hypothetical protein
MWDGAEETERGSSAFGWIATVDQGNVIDVVVNKCTYRRSEGEEFDVGEIADEDAVLHRPTESFHRLVYLAESHGVSDVVTNEVPLSVSHGSSRRKCFVVRYVAEYSCCE